MAKTQAEAIQIYYQLLSQGVDPNTAYQEAVKGMPTQEDLQREAADKQQSAGLASVGGTLAGVIGTKYLYDQLAGETAAEAVKEVATPALTEAVSSGGAAAGGGFAGGEAAAPTILGNAGSMGVLPLAAIAAGVGLGGKAAYDMYKGDKPNLPGRVVLGVATGGLSEVANKLFNRKTTKDYQKERWGELAGSDNLATQNYAKQYQDYLGSDQAGIDAQYPNTFEGKKEAGTIRPEDVWGGYGMFKTFGNDWLNKYNEDQRRSISQGLLDNNLISTSKGDIVLTDENRAREIANQVLGSQPVQKPLVSALMNTKLPDSNQLQSFSNNLGIQKLSPLLNAVTRSQTLSPGIDKNGNRIRY